MTDLETLIAIRELLTDPLKWRKGMYWGFRDEFGVLQPTLSGNSEYNLAHANCFCLAGAYMKVTPGYNVGNTMFAHSKMNQLLGFTAADEAAEYFDVAGFNDQIGRNHSEVLALLDTRIKELSDAA